VVFSIQAHEREIFMLIEQISAQLEMPTYVVGGYVRDRLLGRPSKDMDIVCLGSGIKLAKEMAARLQSLWNGDVKAQRS